MAALSLPTAAADARTAFVANSTGASVSVIDSETGGRDGSDIQVESGPVAVALSPDGRRAYVANSTSSSLSVIDTASRAPAGASIPLGGAPQALAVSPDGTSVYAVLSGAPNAIVKVISASSGEEVGSPIPVGLGASSIAMTPDGSRALVTNSLSNNVSEISTGSRSVSTVSLPGAVAPSAVAITPDGTRAYVANSGSANVSVIDIAASTVAGSTIGVDSSPVAIAVAPDGRRAYVANSGSGDVSVIDVGTNTMTESPIAVGSQPAGITVAPDSKRVYVTRGGASGSVSVINAGSGSTDPPIPVGNKPVGIAFTPDQGPHAGAIAIVDAPSLGVAFNGLGSSDPDGAVASYAWIFGDGSNAVGASPTQTHTYTTHGTYDASLVAIDNEGCSFYLVYTGQTAACAATPEAIAHMSVDLQRPGLSVAAKDRQKSAPDVEFKVSCVEACRLTATGVVRLGGGGNGHRALSRNSFKLGDTRAALEAGSRAKLKLAVPREVKKALKHRVRSATAAIEVRAVDVTGNVGRDSVAIRISR